MLNKDQSGFRTGNNWSNGHGRSAVTSTPPPLFEREKERINFCHFLQVSGGIEMPWSHYDLSLPCLKRDTRPWTVESPMSHGRDHFPLSPTSPFSRLHSENEMILIVQK